MKKRTLLALPALALALPLSAQAADIEISGLMEVEANFSDAFDGTSESGVSLSKVELGFDSQITERVSAHLLMLHEDGSVEPMQVDEGTISIDMGNGLSVVAGRMVASFGAYETNMISDPLTLEVGETRVKAIQLNYEKAGAYGSLYVFNGETIEATTDTAGDDTIEHAGVSLGYVWENDQFSLDVGLDYINSIGNSGGILENLPNASSGNPGLVQDYVGGAVFHWTYNNDNINFIAEFLKTDQFDSSELAFNGQGAELSAMNIELGYSFDAATAAVAYQETSEAVALGLPETRVLLSLSTEIDDNTTLAIEYAMDDDYSIAEGGTGTDASATTLQLAVTF